MSQDKTNIHMSQDTTSLKIQQVLRYNKSQDTTSLKIQQVSRYNKSQDTTNEALHFNQIQKQS